MPLLARTLLTPLAFEVRAGAVEQLGRILSDHRIDTGDETAVLVGPGIGAEVAPLIKRELPLVHLISVTGGSFEAAEELARVLRQGSYQLAIAVGGGRIIDTVKFAAARQGLPMVAVATSLAHDGIASPVAVLDRDGEKVSYGTHLPLVTVVDTSFVRRSPARQTRSGIGDALSNLCAVADWELAHATNGEPIDGLAVALARTGAQAVLTHPGDFADEGLLTTLAHALMMGGIAMAVAGSSRPCSGGCHEVAHGIARLYPQAGTHGEQAALGALFCTWLRDDPARTGEFRAALLRHGLPCVPMDLGLTVDQFCAAVQLAPQTRPDRYTIIEHLRLDPRAVRSRVTRFVREIRDGSAW